MSKLDKALLKIAEGVESLPYEILPKKDNSGSYLFLRPKVIKIRPAPDGEESYAENHFGDSTQELRKAEAEIFMRQIARILHEDNIEFPQNFAMRFDGSMINLIAKSEEALDFAKMIRANLPEQWDEESNEELDSLLKNN